MAQSYEDLLVWQRAIEMSVAIYEFTEAFPQKEMYGLTSQLRRASVSVASNIAEGRGRSTQGEFKHFLGMAQGSNYEIQTQLVLSRHLKFGGEASLQKSEKLSVEVGKMLSALISSIAAKARS